jgi:hypothetical protein
MVRQALSKCSKCLSGSFFLPLRHLGHLRKHEYWIVTRCFIKKAALILLFLLSSGLFINGFGQCLVGTSGAYSIPSGEIGPDRSLFMGMNMLNKEYTRLWERDRHVQTFFATVTFLPFAEISLRFSRPFQDHSTTGDRMGSIRLQVFREKKYRPSLVLGLQGFASTVMSNDASYFNSTYLAATKNFHIGHIIDNVGLNMGYGTDVIKAGSHQFIGVFYGVKLVPEHMKWMEVFCEYDCEKTNAGVRLTLWNHLVLLGGLEGLKAPSGGVSYKLIL